MRLLSYFFLIPLLVFCCCSKAMNEQQETKIRIVNQSQYKVSNISLFSIPFEYLNPQDTSEFKILNFKELEDAPMIYGTVNGINFARYLEIAPLKRNYTYSIDSIQFENRIIYVSLMENE
jgi:hypothetical protein